MPELPEVETIRRGLESSVIGLLVDRVIVREARLRWPISAEVSKCLARQTIERVERRAKYLLIRTSAGTLIVHLGMSGNLRLTSSNEAPRKHDHVDVVFSNGLCLRYRDPRRFGSMLWTSQPPLQHRLLASLGTRAIGTRF